VSRLIALDLDGTLEDSRDDMTAAARRVRAQLGLPARDDGALRPWVNGGMDQLYAKCFDDFIGSGDAAQRTATVREAYEADYMAHVAVATKLYGGIAPALAELRRLGQLACVTNKPERISRHLLDTLGVGELFGTVVGGDSCAQAKPHPMMLSAACERLGFDPRAGRVFMIGDTAADLQLARAFGATGIWVAWGYVASLDPAPELQARTPGELPAIVERAQP
jgi:phosphoglycolate phosphatase